MPFWFFDRSRTDREEEKIEERRRKAEGGEEKKTAAAATAYQNRIKRSMHRIQRVWWLFCIIHLFLPYPLVLFSFLTQLGERGRFFILSLSLCFSLLFLWDGMGESANHIVAILVPGYHKLEDILWWCHCSDFIIYCLLLASTNWHQWI